MLVHMISKPGTLNYWQDTNGFQSVLIDAWSSHVGGSMLFQITKKLKILRVSLKKWRKQSFTLQVPKLQIRDKLKDVPSEG